VENIFEKKRRSRLSRARVLFLVVGYLIIFGLIFSSGYILGKNNSLPLPNIISESIGGDANNTDFSVFREAWKKLHDEYIETLDDQNLVYGAIKGMVEAAGDPYTAFFSPDENQRFKDDISGEFDGIGVEITLEDNLITVVSPLPDSPAEKAGLKAKDVISKVDGTNTADIGLDETINRIRGNAGTTVLLEIIRAGAADPIDLIVIREKITVASVSYEIKTSGSKKIGYIKIRQFGDDTKKLVAEAADKFNSEKVDGVILDLRNNPGGYLETSVDVTSYFIDGGVVVSEVEKSGEKREFKTSESVKLKDQKLVVLVNGGSASASEILAGAIRDRGRGTLIGEKTYGKGSVQILENLSDGSGIKITIAKWYTPNGSQIDGKGIEPDIAVADNDSTVADEVLDFALGQF
jgi:carboxyl-terminal processing protease